MSRVPEIARLDPQGRYGSCSPLGQGTTAQVLAAVDRITGRQVVLKLARDPEMARLFRGEVHLLRRLASPVFPELLDFRLEGDGVPLLVLERRPGHSLEAGVPSGLDALALARILAQLAQGLAELVEHGHLHGDLSPGNVLLDGDRASLLDLGLARPLDGSPGDRSGTLATMAPERLAEGRLHAGGDIWSLGVIGWTLICGRPPFPEEPEACVRAVLAGQRSHPGPGAGHALMPLVEACLAQDPDARPTARDLLARLLDLCDADPALVPRRPVPSRVPRWCRELADRVLAGESGTVWGEHGQEARIWLDWLVQESTLAGRRLLRLDLGADSPLDWARRHLGDHPDLDHNAWLRARLADPAPLPALRAERRRLLNALLDLLAGSSHEPCAGLLMLCTPGGDESWREDWQRLLAERGLQRVRVSPGVLPDSDPGAPEFQLALSLASPEGFREQLAGLVPGIPVSAELVDSLEAVAEGRVQLALDALRLNLAHQRVRWQEGCLRSEAALTSPEGARRLDPADLDPGIQELLAELAVWSALAGQALWFERRQQAGWGPALGRLEAEALVRDRGDGVPLPIPGLGERLAPGLLEQAHGRLYHWLGTRTGSRGALLLEHLAQSPDGAVPPEELLARALESSGTGYPESRIRVLEKALAVAPAPRHLALLSLLVQALQETGQPERAREALRRIFRLDPISRSDRVQALIQLGYLYQSRGQGRLARRSFAAALASSDPGVPQERLKALTQVALSLWRLGRIGDARGLLGEGGQLLTRFDPPWSRQLCYQANLLGALAFALGDSAQAGRLWTELLSNSGREADPGELVRARMNLALVHAHDDRLEEARAELERAAGEALELHFETVLAEVRVNQAHLDFLEGRVIQAGHHLEQASRLCELTEERALLPAVLYAGADVDYRCGRLDEALEKLERLAGEARRQQRPVADCEARALRLLIDSDLGLLPAAEEEQEFIRRCTELDEQDLLLEWQLVAASLGRGPVDAVPSGGPCPRRALLGLLVTAEENPQPVIQAVLDLPVSEWPLRDRLLLNLAELGDHGPLLELLQNHLPTDRLSPFQQVHLGLVIGRAKLRQGRLAQAGEHLGQAVKVLRSMADSRVLKSAGRYREAPVTQALAQQAQLCQRMIRESRP